MEAIDNTCLFEMCESRSPKTGRDGQLLSSVVQFQRLRDFFTASRAGDPVIPHLDWSRARDEGLTGCPAFGGMTALRFDSIYLLLDAAWTLFRSSRIAGS